MIGSPVQLGSADYGEARKGTVTVRNNSGTKLHLEFQKKACACSIVSFDTDELNPGQSATITFDWQPKPGTSEPGKTRLWADVADKTGKHSVRVEAEGDLNPAVRMNFPRGGLDVGPLEPASLADPRKAFVAEVYTTDERYKELKISKVTEPLGWKLKETSEPLTADRLKELKAVQGFRITLEPTKALPVGAFLTPFQIVMEKPERTLELALRGSMETGALEFVPQAVLLPISHKLGTKYLATPVTIRFRFGECKKMELRKFEPGFLEVKVTPSGENTWKIHASIPENIDAWKQKVSPTIWQNALYYGIDSGMIELTTDHPDFPNISIPVTTTRFEK